MNVSIWMKCIVQDKNVKCITVIAGETLFFYSSMEVLNISKSEFMCQNDTCINLPLWMLFRNNREIVISKAYFKGCLFKTLSVFNYQIDNNVSFICTIQ